MGSRFVVLVLAAGVASPPLSCGGKSVRSDGESGAEEHAEEAGRAGTGGSGGSGRPVLNGGSGGSGGTGAAASKGGTGGSSSTSGGGPSTSGGGPSSGAAPSGSGGAACGNSRISVPPDQDGWMDLRNWCVGVQGGWYAFGDQYPDRDGVRPCVDIGQHTVAECAQVTSPDPTLPLFPNMNGFMYTAGFVEKILPCPLGLTTSGCPDHDYANMWGAGIGFDLNSQKPSTPGEDLRDIWDPKVYGVTGISFSIDTVPLAGLRVEFPIVLPDGSDTDSQVAGAPYWGAQSSGDGRYPKSPVVIGVNTIRWTEIQSPLRSAYVFDSARLLSVRFHVVAGTDAPFEFTISNVTFLRD